MASVSASVISSALIISVRSVPGSPWIPIPSSISSSPRSKVGSPFSGGDTRGERGAHGPDVDVVDYLLRRALDLREIGALCGLRAGGLVDVEDRPADAAPAGGVQRVLDGHVVVDHDALDLDTLHLGEFDSGLEVHHVASPRSFLMIAGMPSPASQASISSSNSSAVGEENTSPAAAPSSMPSPM